MFTLSAITLILQVFDVADFKENLTEECSANITDEQAVRNRLMGTCKVSKGRVWSRIKHAKLNFATFVWIIVY